MRVIVEQGQNRRVVNVYHRQSIKGRRAFFPSRFIDDDFQGWDETTYFEINSRFYYFIIQEIERKKKYLDEGHLPFFIYRLIRKKIVLPGLYRHIIKAYKILYNEVYTQQQ